jgi:uncharacterized protein (TIGR03437 family)
MQLRWLLCFGLTGVYIVAQTPDVGTGAPDATIQMAFVSAYDRNAFFTLVGTPTGNVVKYGTTGLIQQFPAVNSKTSTLALIKPDTNDTYNVVQVQASMFAYYGTISVGTAGYPTSDTLKCPGLVSFPSNSCQWQPFSSNYALFVYAAALPNTAQNFATRDPFFTKWNNLGGVTGLGPANSAEAQVTSQYKSAATFQTYDQGAIYNITSGVLTGRLLAVKGPIYTLYVSYGGQAGSLGLPATDELLLPNGMHQQTFEGGAIQLDPTTGIAVLRPPIDSLVLMPAGSIHLNLGDTAAVQVTPYTANGTALTDRAVAWTTSNGRVVQIQSTGYMATLKAVGAGTAVASAGAEGKTSSPLTVTVTAPCCQIGEGAPGTVQQAFQDVITRDKLSIQLPAASPALRVGSGYVQVLLSTGMAPVTYLVAVADGSITGYVVSGSLLAQYNGLGGPAGMLGYPLSDATMGGRQTFQRGTLAGNPVQLVTGAILDKWGALGYETGVAGPPVSPATRFQTFRGVTGSMQSFQNALIMTMAMGPLAGQTFSLSGLVLAQYNSNGGPGGDLGAPTDDEHVVNGLRQQDFEGGYVNYSPGAAVASVFTNLRQPLVTATPGSVIAGTPVHLVVGGFNNGATVRVSQTGQPDFIVAVANGSYAWDVLVPASAPSSLVTIRAVDVSSTASGQGSYTVRSASSVPLALSVVSGDAQSGAPGAQLAQPLVVAVRDQNGNPVPGQAVTFAASPGAQVVPASGITDARGQASTTLRMPMPAGVALATAQAEGKVLTFSAKSVAFSLTNFPTLTQAVDGTLGNGSDTIRQKGALLTAAASILRYYQSLNQLPQPNGLADPTTLNQFLKSFCTSGSQVCDGFVSLGQSREQTLNLWRLGAFVGGAADLRIESIDLNHIRDLVASGSPVLLALSLNGLGSHFVVATGIASDGGLAIADPNPAFGQTSLSGYLNGFHSAGGGAVQGVLSGAVRLLPQAPSSPGFLVIESAPVSVASGAGTCGQTLQFPDSASVTGATPANSPGTLYFRACDGAAGPYQLDIEGQAFYLGTFTDLSQTGTVAFVGGDRPASSLIVQNGAQWTLASLQASIAAGGIVNAASFTGDIAPGGLISIYGTGFVRSGVDTTVQVNGEPATLLAVLPFQINAQVPLDIAPGPATLSVNTGNGSAQQSMTVAGAAPAIFSITPTLAAITNLNNSLNSPSNPAFRGSAIVVYCTGLGTVAQAGPLSVASTPVSIVLGGTELPTAFAGLTPGLIGLYQVNVLLPTAVPPGLYLPLYLKQAGVTSNTVTVAIQ